MSAFVDPSQPNVSPTGVDGGWLRILSHQNANGPAALEAGSIYLSQHVAQVFVKEPVALGAAVRLDRADDLFLGEVSYCRPDPQGGYLVGIEIQQTLASLGALTNLMGRLLGETRALDGRGVRPNRG